MRRTLKEFRLDFHSPWQWSLFLITLIPLFPEYCSFVLVVAAVIPALISLRRESRRIHVGTIGKCLLAVIGYMALSVCWSQDKLLSAGTVLMWLFLFAVYLICANLLTDLERFEFLLFYITVVAGTVGLIACFQYRIGFLTNSNPIMFWEWLDRLVYPHLPFNIAYPQYVLRSCSTFCNPNILSEYLTATAPFVVYFNFYERRENIRLFSRICLLLTFGGIVFSFSRGGYIAIILLLLCLIVMNFRHRFATITLYIIATLLLLPEEVFDRMLSIKTGISAGTRIVSDVAGSSTVTYSTAATIIENAPAELSLDVRWRIWIKALQAIGQRPVFGYGAGVQASRPFMDEIGPYVTHSHNIALQFLMEGGIIGLLLMLIVGILVVRNGIMLVRKGFGHSSFWNGFAILGFVAALCVQGMVDFPLLSPKLICNFMLIVGMSEISSTLFRLPDGPLQKKIRKRFKVKVSEPG